MFNCQICNKTQEAYLRSRRVPVAQRTVHYVSPGGGKGYGFETISEIVICNSCEAPAPSRTTEIKEVFFEPKKRKIRKSDRRRDDRDEDSVDGDDSF